jgi:hypothetical protein
MSSSTAHSGTKTMAGFENAPPSCLTLYGQWCTSPTQHPGKVDADGRVLAAF